MKAILVIGDGMADRPLKEFDWKTPLEAAHNPTMDLLAKIGVCGLMDPISPGIPPGSDTATLALLGYDALKVYSGRGALEALGSGINVSEGDVCLRCNFATVDENFTVLDRRAGRIADEDSRRLAESLSEVKLSDPSVSFQFQRTLQHRAVLVLRGPKLSKAVSDSDPGEIGVKVLEIKPLNGCPESAFTAKILNELMQKFHKILKEHPVNIKRAEEGLPQANMILCRGAGDLPKIRPLKEVYNVNAVCIAATSLVKGVCKTAGMHLSDVEGATGTRQTDYLAKAKAAMQAIKTSDFVLLHVKAPDVASHDGDAKQKIEVIEKIDQMLSHIFNEMDSSETYVALTADHTTSCITRKHDGEPVPIAITGPDIRSDKVEEFSERACANGGLGRIRGMDLMPILMNYLGKVKKFGA
ncbi:MAG: 2,3-bisphosphoglycerate-independent phosphoglycerate mutase [Candidatus Bathyarchaeia archaeon]